MKSINVTVSFSVAISELDISGILSKETIETSSWLKEIKPMGRLKGNSVGEHLINGGQVFVYDTDGKFWQLNLAKFQKGIAKFIQENGEYFDKITVVDAEGNILFDLGGITDEGCDTIIQYAIFGKLNYF